MSSWALLVRLAALLCAGAFGSGRADAAADAIEHAAAGTCGFAAE